MKIVCLVTNDLSHDQRMDRICTTLVEAGHTVTLVGRKLPASPDLPEKPYRQYRVRCRYHSGKLFYLEYNFRLLRKLKQWDFDTVCAVDLDTLLAGFRLARGRKRLVFDAHEWFTETPEVVSRPLVKGIWRGLGKALIPRTDVRYTVGPQLAEKLGKVYGVPFGTVRNVPLRNRIGASGRDTIQDRRPRSGAKVMLYQGMLNPGRGLETAIQAMDHLPDHELWLVGDGPLLGDLRRCAAGLTSKGRVRFLGFRPPAELPTITERAWLGLNLLDAVSPSYYYSLANKAMDYPQAGVPSVQMDFPEYRAVNAQYGCYALLEELSVKALVNTVQSLTVDEARYARMVAGCEAAGEALCWELERESLLKYWKTLP